MNKLPIPWGKSKFSNEAAQNPTREARPSFDFSKKTVYTLVSQTQGGHAMQKMLIKHGNSLALVIDKPILELLQISQDTPLEISTDGDHLLVKPCRDPRSEEHRLNSSHT